MVLRRAFLAASTTWAAALPLAAFVGSRQDPATVLPGAYGFALAVYAVGHVVCHQLPARSFHLWGSSLPVCARCTGVYLGAAVTSIGLSIGLPARARRVHRSAKREGGSAKAGGQARVLLLAAVVPTAATLVFEWTTGTTPANWIRALAGVPLGAAVAWAIGMVN